ncbi:hypothetical protein FH966_10680 [Lentibacillus cibarius]|uniref:Uncharacterized protein n=1 Tax=Lentibacillus cibarius TaxID=2583219 RepID=A0A549YJR3_9BACI|nr:hypothetical protein [Lentibacillus cibarius]TRM12111.1 hypothetical protein FH966_10680 [Lentibacillus cibarius]
MERKEDKGVFLMGGDRLIDNNDLYFYVYKSLKLSTKLKKNISVERIKTDTYRKELIFHPMWLAKLLVIADRKPFPPKQVPMICFVDAVSGYRGLSSEFKITKCSTEPTEMKEPKIVKQEDIERYIKDVQNRQINRSYILKKPRHKIVDYSLVYLPLWKIEIDSVLIPEPLILNANTGESEKYLSSQWGTDNWFLQ